MSIGLQGRQIVGKWIMMEWIQSVIFQMVVAKKRKAADENHVFQSKETGKYFFCLKNHTLLHVVLQAQGKGSPELRKRPKGAPMNAEATSLLLPA